jgi:hypothetical protein
MARCASADADWYHLYTMMKKKYNELHRIRVSAVQEDIATVQARIQEHRDVHAETVEDIQLQSEDLRRTIQLVGSTKDEIRSMQENIKSLQRVLRCRDSVLNVLIEYPELRVRITNSGSYRVSAGLDDEFQFGLTKDTQIQYLPLKVPGHREVPDSFRETFEMNSANLPGFCRDVIDIVAKLKPKL